MNEAEANCLPYYKILFWIFIHFDLNIFLKYTILRTPLAPTPMEANPSTRGCICSSHPSPAWCLASALCAVYCDICDASTRGQMEKNQGQADTKPTWANKISKELIKFSRKFISINCTSLPPPPCNPSPSIVCALPRQQTVCRPVSGKLPPFPNLIYLLHLPTLQELYLLFIVLYIIYFFHNHCFQCAQNN